MANTYKQPTQSDLDREEFRLNLASAQNKVFKQSQTYTQQSAADTDYTTAPDRISLSDLNKLNQSIASGASKSDSPVLDFWKRQQAAKSAANADYTTAPDRISLYDLGQMDKTAASGASKSDSPVLDFWKRQQAARSAQGADYTTAPDWMPFTQANAWAGGTTAETKATNLSSAGQLAPWLNTPQYGDDGTLLLQEKLAQTGNSGYDKSTRKIGGLIDEAALDAAIAEAFPEYSPDDDDEDDWLEKPLQPDDEDNWLESEDNKAGGNVPAEYSWENSNQGILQLSAKAHEKESWRGNPNKRKGSENRQKSGSRERNVGHPDSEEHSRVPKGSGGRAKGSQGPLRADTSDEVGRAVLGGIAAVGTGYLIYRGLRLLPSLLPPLWWTIGANLAAP